MERQRFTAEFKREAVRLMERGDKPVAQLALELGLPRNRLYKWRKTGVKQGSESTFSEIRQVEVGRL